MFKPTQSYSSPTTYSKTYDKFRGVDFSSDPSKVASYRSPDAVNMISDAGGMPEKRVGWRTILYAPPIQDIDENFVTRPFSHIHSWECPNEYKKGRFKGVETLHVYMAYAHEPIGGTIYTWCAELGVENAVETWISGIGGDKGVFIDIPTSLSVSNSLTDNYEEKRPVKSLPCFIHDWCIFLLRSVRIDESDPSKLAVDWVDFTDGQLGYAPITSIDRKPDGSAGKSLERVNLLTRKRRNRFKGDGESKTFVVDSPINKGQEVYAYVWDTDTQYVMQGTIEDAEKGEITFESAPPKALGTDDNVEITFTALGFDGAIDIRKCTIATNFTAGADDNRIILSGHPDFPNYEWYSANNEGLYFPDINYTVVGLPTSAIKGYCDYGQYQVVVKEGDGTPNIYLRSYTENKDGELVFTLTQGNVSADALGATSTLNGQPLFLSSSGVIGLVSTAVKSDTAFNNVSYFINNKLLEEPNLEKAIAVLHKQKVYIFVNSHVYILDGTQNKAYVEAAVDDYSYECFYWDDVPATCAISDGETIWFGTADGYICRFNNDMTGYDRYNNYDINGNATPVKAHWCTALDYDNSVGIAKTLIRKGTTVTLKPAKRTSADIYVRTDEIPFELVAQFSINTPNFNGFSFKGFAFEVLNTPIDVPVSAVVKNYSYLQIKVQNDKLNEPFGLYGITKYFRKGRYK